jgi:hypothetical protein
MSHHHRHLIRTEIRGECRRWRLLRRNAKMVRYANGVIVFRRAVHRLLCQAWPRNLSFADQLFPIIEVTT